MTRETTANTKLLNGSSGDRRRGRARIRSAAVVTALIGTSTVLGVLVAQQLPSQSALALSSEFGGTSASELAIELVPSAIDFGKVQVGTQAHGSVTIINHGREPLWIDDINTTCGCTVAEVPSDPIAPGRSVDVAVRMNVDNSVGKRSTKTLTFIFRDGTTRKLPVSSTSEEFIRLSAAIIDPRHAPTEPLVVTSTDERSFHITKVDPPVLDGVARHALTRHTLQFSAEAWAAHDSPRWVKLSLDHPEVSELTVKIGTPKRAAGIASGNPVQSHADRPDELQVHPQRLSFGDVNDQSPSERRVFVRTLTSNAQALAKIALDQPGLWITVVDSEPAENGVWLTIQVGLQADAAAPPRAVSIEAKATVSFGDASGTFTIYANPVQRPD